MSNDRQKRIIWCIIGFALNIPALSVCWLLDLHPALSLLSPVFALILAMFDLIVKEDQNDGR